MQRGTSSQVEWQLETQPNRAKVQHLLCGGSVCKHTKQVRAQGSIWDIGKEDGVKADLYVKNDNLGDDSGKLGFQVFATAPNHA